MSKLLREPLLHFLLLGAALFLIHGWMGGRTIGDGERIVITQGRVEQLAMGFSRMHQRVPDARELEEMIDDAIREEIYYREAKALALDEDDTIIRRRLRQKLEFVSEDVAPVPEPNDAQLLAYLQARPEKFRIARRYSITHAYLNPERHGLKLDDAVRHLLAELRRGGGKLDVGGRGDAFLLGYRFDDIDADELARLFGKDFETRLRTVPIGEWQGPVPSGYGMHVVLVRSRVDDHVPLLASVRIAVRDEWVRAQRLLANERFYADLRERYAVTVERPSVYGGAAVAASSQAGAKGP